MPLFGSKTPVPEPDEPDDAPSTEAADDLSLRAEAFEGLGLNAFEAFACAWEGLSPSLLREFLRKNPKCDVRTAVAILL